MATLLGERLDTGWIKPMRLEAAVMFIALLVCALLAQLLAALLGRYWFAGYLLLAPGFVLVYAAPRRLALRRSAHEVRGILLARGHCASCGYTLTELPSRADGLTTCPECSAIWRLGTDRAARKAGS